MPSRRGRSFYVPPHLRHPTNGAFFPDSDFPSDPPPHPHLQHYPPFFGSSRGRPGRGRGGDAGNRGRRRQQQPFGRSATSPEDRRREPFNDPEPAIADGAANGDLINFEAYEDVAVEASGEDIPAPASSFEEIDLGETLNKNIVRCRYTKPTPVQRHAIPIALAGRDLMACAQTGSGKTAAFCLPIIAGLLKSGGSNGRRPPGSRVSCPTVLVLSPTRELSCQIYEEAKKFAYQSGIKLGVAYGGASFSQQGLVNHAVRAMWVESPVSLFYRLPEHRDGLAVAVSLVRILERGVDILVATPGRLVDMVEKDRVSLRMIKYLAIDEADRMLDMGFEPQIRKIVERMDMPPAGTRQTVLFSATFPNDIQILASDFLSNYIFLAVGKVGSSTELIAQKVEYVEDMDKKRHLKDLLHFRLEDVHHGKQELTLVFVETKRGADFLEGWLSRSGFPAIAIHGDKIQIERERALRSFKSGATPIMVATDVASRGLDIPNVAHVVNFDLPKCISDYVHRIGRTGRAGKSGLATAFFNSKNVALAKALADLMKETKQVIPTWLAQCAEQSYDAGNGNGMSRNHRGNNFGGRDFRKGGSRFGNKNYSSYNNYDYPTATDDYAPAYAADSYGNPGNYDYNGGTDASADQGHALGYESIEPSGWE